jgi:hypothetical protein
MYNGSPKPDVNDLHFLISPTFLKPGPMFASIEDPCLCPFLFYIEWDQMETWDTCQNPKTQRPYAIRLGKNTLISSVLDPTLNTS